MQSLPWDEPSLQIIFGVSLGFDFVSALTSPGEVNDGKRNTSGFAPDFSGGSHLLAMLWLLVFLLQSHPDSEGTGKSGGRQQGISFKLGYTRMGTRDEKAKRAAVGYSISVMAQIIEKTQSCYS